MKLDKILPREMIVEEVITCLTLHQFQCAEAEGAKRFFKSRGGRWSALPPETGARYFIEFPPDTRIIAEPDEPSPDQRHFQILLPDGTCLQAISRRIGPPGYRINTLILPEEVFACVKRPPDLLMPIHRL